MPVSCCLHGQGRDVWRHWIVAQAGCCPDTFDRIRIFELRRLVRPAPILPTVSMLTTVVGTRGTTVEHMDGSGRHRTFKPSKATVRNLRLHEIRSICLHTTDRIRVPGIGMAIDGRTVHLEAGEGRLRRFADDDRDRLDSLGADRGRIEGRVEDAPVGHAAVVDAWRSGCRAGPT